MNLEKMNARRAAVVTPNDVDDLPFSAFALYIGGAGTITIRTPEEDDCIFTVPAGFYLNVQTTRVFSTGTTATLIVALA